ncbi:guanine deaminase [Heyndrickxia ginsengihumi]|uniref:Guanine deaminase n=1 Tax=Heyndrickxia ginsengihumi TaxID=363870 RepID=A0A0A6VBW0_9BACI|nr:nucleoside deaminase [Heyndrickxia ginsengihumi]KHD85066.1 guanine deaminase [Heyndrickxia ginsengihumi]MBE6184448.1 nucleoside deaminase [Bacillus sp. (in: firmicutes)]
MTDIHRQFLQQAIKLAENNVLLKGGPFGAVIAKGDELIATGVNRVTANSDPTAHAEVTAIREACKQLQTFDLSGCTLYTSCEPCPMCLGAIYWARLDSVYFAATRQDAASVQFDDDFIYKEVPLDPKNRTIPFHHQLFEEALRPFEKWNHQVDKMRY